GVAAGGRGGPRRGERRQAEVVLEEALLRMPLADGRAHGIDDDGFAHGLPPPARHYATAVRASASTDPVACWLLERVWAGEHGQDEVVLRTGSHGGRIPGSAHDGHGGTRPLQGCA